MQRHSPTRKDACLEKEFIIEPVGYGIRFQRDFPTDRFGLSGEKKHFMLVSYEVQKGYGLQAYCYCSK